MFQYFPGDLIDSRLDMYLLDHGYKWLSGDGPRAFTDAPFFYPARGVIAYSENFLGQLPLYVPWRMMGSDRETALQIWVAIGFLLNYLSGCLGLEEAPVSLGRGACGRLRVHVLSSCARPNRPRPVTVSIPLAWYFLHRFLEEFSFRDLLGCAFFVFWQACCSLYEGYFLVVFLAAFAVFTAIRRPVLRHYASQATAASIAVHGAIAAVFVAALALLLHPYLAVGREQDLAAVRWQEAITMLPRPVSYLISWPGNFETGWLYERAGVPMRREHALFVGLIPWACVLFLWLTRKRSTHNPAVIPAILVMLSIMVLTLYFNGVSLYLTVMRIPALVGLRGVSRWILILLLPFAVATAHVVHLCLNTLKSLPRAVGVVLLLGAAAALVLENHVTPYRFAKVEAQRRVQALAAQLPAHLSREAILASLVPATGLERQPSDIDAMLVALDKDIVTVNGYSSYAPKGYRPLRECADLKRTLDDTQRLTTSFPVDDAESRVVVVGTAVDTPCKHLNSHATVQREPLPSEAFRAKIEIVTPTRRLPQSG